jgi:hypothetical protein
LDVVRLSADCRRDEDVEAPSPGYVITETGKKIKIPGGKHDDLRVSSPISGHTLLFNYQGESREYWDVTAAFVAAKLDADIKKLNTQKLALDPSILRVMPGYLPLVEQFGQKKYTLVACLSYLNVSKLKQSPPASE